MMMMVMKAKKTRRMNTMVALLMNTMMNTMVVSLLMTIVATMIGGVNCQQQQSSSSYFNDTTLFLDTLTIIQTHNSLAQPRLVLSPNQNVDLVQQFQDGIRGFNFDLYSQPSNNNGGGGGGRDLWTYHGLVETWGYDPTTQILDLVAELTTRPTEFIIIEIQDSMDFATVTQKFVPLFGSLLIKNFDSTKPISYYIGLNQRVLVMTPNDSNVDPSIGMHDTKRLTHENNYQWDTNTCLDGSAVPSTQERYPPAKSWNNKYTRPLRVMNHFCVNPTFRSGDANAARVVNRPARILQSVNELASVEPFSPQINMIHVDFYELGDVFDALRRLQEMAGYFTSDNVVGTVVDQVIDQCWPDSTVCDVSTTCWQCCVDETYWTSKSSHACGTDEVGTVGTGTTEEEQDVPQEVDVPQEENTNTGNNEEEDVEVDCWPEGTRCAAEIFGSTCEQNCCSGAWTFTWMAMSFNCE